MNRILTIVLVSISSIAFSHGSDLQTDIVKVVGGKFTFDMNFAFKDKEDNRKQIKLHSEAPATGVISRDKFVFLTTVLIAGIASNGNVSIEYIDEIIGNADGAINFYMAKSGIQMEIVEDGKKTRDAVKWEDIIN